ncbi:MAG: isoleucine--tRNA ligase [Gemmataceae bacterium]|nr:isoleucine--tRNA ligase [Gemmataceae bacterium]
MPFEKVDTSADFPAEEREVLRFWDEVQAFAKLRAKNVGKKPWSFLDGPITANNPMGVHHAWGRTYKDAYQRYFAMTGHELRYQNGFDCQGLWVEVEVEKDLRENKGHTIATKRDIENLVEGDKFKSIDLFVHECKERVNKFARRQSEQSIRLGYWMDWDLTDADWAKDAGERKSYFTMGEDNNYTIWAFLKKCHGRDLIYKSYDAMPWCGRCGTGISQQEMNEGYHMVAHRSVFVKFPLRPSPRMSAAIPGGETPENLLIWTTTPWTLSSNVGAAVNPKLTYIKVKHKDEIYYVAKGAFTAQRLEEQFKRKEWLEGVPKLKTLEQIFKEKGGYEIVGELLGAHMVGWQYDGPFDELDAQNSPLGYPVDVAAKAYRGVVTTGKSAKEIHKVVAWDIVGETEGTGIVHIAPGCGKEDFTLGKEQGLVPVAPLDDSGVFIDGFGELTGKSANDPATTDWILDNLTKKNRLLAVEKYPHSYPHCWRCKNELLFRLVDEWFIDMRWREEIMRVVEDVTFLPESINGKAREMDWLRNMGDWMISKKRFWGLALPIWVDEVTGDFEVIGSREELKARAVEGWPAFDGHSPHRPWIDLIKIKNPKTGNLMSRIPDVGNPWLDAGIVPFSTMKYNTDRAYWDKWFPADFITECFPGQFRNWFYAILAMSTMMTGRAPFKVLLGHGLVRDQWGEEMHKSTGNAIPFDGAVDGEKIDGFDKLAYLIKHELKQGEQAVVPGSYSVSTTEEMRHGKKAKVAVAICPPISADLMRWMYCRQQPASNINFGPTTADEVRSKFIMKLWHSYAFFCELARLPGDEGYDPALPQIAIKDRPDVDRWILSDLQGLIGTAHTAFQAFDVMNFCLAAEAFVEDKLSNWYVRTQKDRFWATGRNPEKLAAFQTLHTVIVTLAKLCTPIVPFMTEKMYHNLGEPGGAKLAESVHLCDYPVVNETLLDADLTTDMDALLRLVSLGRSVRQNAKIKVRQPLAEMKVQPGSEAERHAVERFAEQIKDELNLKAVSLHDAKAGPLLTFEVKLNPKAAGPKFGPRLGAVQSALAKVANAAEVLQAGKAITLELADESVSIEFADVWITPRVVAGWSGLADHGTQLSLDARISLDLASEGLARDIIRNVQNTRKAADLNINDRIALRLHTGDPKIKDAIHTHRDAIASETLVSNWATDPLGVMAHHAEVKLDGAALVIELRKHQAQG